MGPRYTSPGQTTTLPDDPAGMGPPQPWTTSAPASPSGSGPAHKQACILCAKRKVRCDRREPCSNCIKAHTDCDYQAPAPRRRRRKRPADEDLVSRLSRYEELMRKNNIDFSLDQTAWVPSRWEEDPKQAGVPTPATSVLSSDCFSHQQEHQEAEEE